MTVLGFSLPVRITTLIVLGASAAIGCAVAFGGAIAAGALLAIPLAGFTFARLARNPVDGLMLTIVAGFVGAGLSRYVMAPTGLLVDAALAVTVLVILLSRTGDHNSGTLKNTLVAFVCIWFVYNLGELLNPQRPSIIAWFYAMRGVALYWVLAIPAALLVFKPARDLDRFTKWWLGLSVIGTLWGLKQLYIGLDSAEQAWLAIPGNQTTHLLFGKLRVFSFYSDTGQFGAAQGHAAVVSAILALGTKRLGMRVVLFAVAGLSMLGLLISGTRGAMAVPFAGFLTYLLLSKNWRILIVGLLVLVAAFSILKFTYIGHGTYEIRRMRTAVQQGADNPSLRVRLENQERLGKYLQGKPFGGGVGSAGYWGQRFSPDTFLANLALDSWYVKIWAEQGIVGLVLYLGLILLVLYQSLRRLLRVEDHAYRQKLLALFCGLVGILLASYSNQVLGQMPTGIVVAFSFAFLFLPPPTADGQDEHLDVRRRTIGVGRASIPIKR